LGLSFSVGISLTALLKPTFEEQKIRKERSFKFQRVVVLDKRPSDRKIKINILSSAESNIVF
jgi:hypothetical protein